MSHPSRSLWECHAPPNGYPPGVVPVPTPIPGLAFFPGGYGLWGCAADRPLPPLPESGVMVLGHDFHSETGYARSLQLGGEPETMPTWRNLLGLLGEVGISPEKCFFTNIYMGLRAGSATTGVFPGANDAKYVEHCKRFFLEQLRMQQPKLILTLGIHVPPIIGLLSPELNAWSQGRGLRHLEEKGPVQTKVTFKGIGDYSTTVVALIHPSLRHASLRHRSYLGEVKHAAEIRMLREGIQLSGLTL